MSAPSSSSEARTEPPSDSRVDEARAQGHVPRAELMGLAATSVVLVTAFAFISGDLVALVHSSLRVPLDSIAAGARPTIVDVPQDLIRRLGPSSAGVLVLCAISALVARAVAQGFTFRIGKPARAKRFAAIQRTRWISAALFTLVACVVVGAALPELLRAEARSLLPLLSRLAFRLAAMIVLVAVLDALFARTAWWRSLWMTRHERRTEEREAYGTPELRAARDRLRRESHAERSVRSRS